MHLEKHWKEVQEEEEEVHEGEVHEEVQMHK